MSTSRSVRLLSALIISAIPLAVFAASPHYKKGGQPVCTASGASVTCSTGQVTGLGTFDVQIKLAFTASQGQFCHNKGNPANVVPGQNPAIGSGGGGLTIPASEIKNGNLTIPEVSGTATITKGTPAQAGCPNDNWTVTLEGPITVTGGTYTFQSPPGNTISALSFTF